MHILPMTFLVMLIFIKRDNINEEHNINGDKNNEEDEEPELQSD